MHTSYVIFYGKLCYDLKTDSEHLYILRKHPLAGFSQFKSTTLL